MGATPRRRKGQKGGNPMGFRLDSFRLIFTSPTHILWAGKTNPCQNVWLVFIALRAIANMLARAGCRYSWPAPVGNCLSPGPATQHESQHSISVLFYYYYFCGCCCCSFCCLCCCCCCLLPFMRAAIFRASFLSCFLLLFLISFLHLCYVAFSGSGSL